MDKFCDTLDIRYISSLAKKEYEETKKIYDKIVRG